MLAVFRSFLNTWAAKAFFLLLVASFALWGVADVVRNPGNDRAVATVGERKIELPELQDAYRRQLQQVTRVMGGRAEPSPAIRQGVAAQALDRLIAQAALAQETRRLGITVPDEALRQAVFDVPAFQGRTGAFDRNALEAVLRNNNLTEARFLDLMRADLAQRQLVEAARSGAVPPDVVTRRVFALQRETRVADLVELAFAAAPEPPEPDEAALRRHHENNPHAYSAPERRRVKAVILSPDTVARGIEVPEAELRAYYDGHRAEYVAPEKRSVQVVVAQDETAARTLAERWAAGAGWDEVQRLAEQAGASTVTLDDATRAELPSPELAEAVFTAAPGAVAGPIGSALGWQVLRVAAVTPGSERTFEAARDEVRARVARDRAVDQVYANANKLEDALGAGSSLDELPADIGLAGVTGTLDAQGNAPSGDPAPLPGSPALRKAVVDAAFAAAQGEAPRLIEGPEQSYFAVAVEEVSPAALKPFEQVADQVREDWERDARRREQETAAAKLLAAVKGGTSLQDAATVAGLRVERTPPIGRGEPPEGVARELVEPLFGLKRGEPTMVETPEGFVVAVPVEVASPDPAADPAGLAQLRAALGRSMGEDVEVLLASAARARANPRVNRQLLDSVAQP